MRLILIIAVLAVGYDAVVYQGAYTRKAWDNAVAITGSAVSGARQLGHDKREETTTNLN